MVRRITVVGFIIYCMAIPSALAGTWRDDFEDKFVGWEGVNASWTVEDGECSGEFFNAPGGIIELIIMGDIGWKDYTVKCRMRFVGEGLPSGFAGVSFRDTNVARYGFVINAGTNTAEVWKVFQGAITYPLKTPLLFTLSKDTWYELKITAEGDHFELYIDGEPVGEFEDNSIPSGKVGLCVRNTHAHFDNLIISGDGVEDGGSVFAVTSQSKLSTTWGEIKSD